MSSVAYCIVMMLLSNGNLIYTMVKTWFYYVLLFQNYWSIKKP